MSHALIIGCGYVGRRVAQRWRGEGHDLTVLTRSAETAEQLAADGFRTMVADVTEPTSLAALPDCDTMLFAVGYRRGSPKTMREVYAGGLRNVLTVRSALPRRVIYISSTGVYGPAGGAWLDEQSAASPEREGGIASLAAEMELRRHAPRDGSVVLRLAGIYGPHRVPYLDRLRAGEPLPVPEDSYLNLIHVDDAAAAVVAAAQLSGDLVRADDGRRLYCVSDGCPVLRGDYYREVSRLLGAEPPRFCDPPADAAVTRRAAGNKRISNARMRRELEFQLAFPTFREGLQAILSASPE